MLSKKMVKAINDQIVKEFYSSYFYLAMSSWFEAETMPGAAQYMRLQAQEESCHALIFFNYLHEMNERAVLGAIDAPPDKFRSPLHVFEENLAHEKRVTALIHKLAQIADADKDYATRSMLDWFIKEQVEEESNARVVIGKLQRVKSNGEALLMIDNELGARVFTIPPPLVGKI